MKKIIISLLKSIFILILLFLPSRFIDLASGTIYFIVVLLTAIPIAFNALSRFSLYKEVKLIEYKAGTKLFRLLSGKFFGYLVIISFSIAVAFILPVRLYLLSNIEILLLLIVLPIFMITTLLFRKLFGYIYNKSFASYRIERWVYISSAFLSAAIYPILTYYLHAEKSNLLANLEDNYIAFLIGHFLATFDNITASILNISYVATAPSAIFISILVLLSGGGIIFYALINFISFFFLKRDNLRKSLFSLKLGRYYNSFIVSFIIVFTIFIIYPFSFQVLKVVALKNSSKLEEYLHIVRVEAEIINAERYKAGTYELIQNIKLSFEDSTKEAIIDSIDKIYDNMSTNIDRYLDWYYSLQSEYKRLVRLIAGNSEAFLKENMRSILADNISSFDDRIALKKEAELKGYISEQLKKNRIDNMTLVYNIQNIYEDKRLLDISDNCTLLAFRTHFKSEVGRSLEPENIAVRVADSAATMNGFKNSKEALIRITGSKLVGIAAGTISGIFASAAITPAGGIAVGAATGLAVDKAFQELEQLVKRDEYKNEILGALERDREKSKAKIKELF